MPLKPGKKNIGKNYKELEKANVRKSPGKKRSKKQMIAIVLNKAYGKKK